MQLKQQNKRALILAAILATSLAATTVALAAQDQEAATISADQVQEEAAQAMQALANYTAQERDQALSAARKAMQQLDQQIDQREDALRDQWADMSTAAREQAKATLAQLRQTRNALGERYGALESGMDSAWNELRDGFTSAYEAVVEAWNATD